MISLVTTPSDPYLAFLACDCQEGSVESILVEKIDAIYLQPFKKRSHRGRTCTWRIGGFEKPRVCIYRCRTGVFSYPRPVLRHFQEVMLDRMGSGAHCIALHGMA